MNSAFNKKTKVMPTWVFYALFLIVFGPSSYLYLSAYRFGDQVYYRDFYSSLADAHVGDTLLLQSFYTGSGEPLFGLIAWVGAKLSIEKDIYFSILNALFGLALLRFLRNNSANAIYTILAFLNYYVLVMLGPAERLKIAFLFLLIAINFSGRSAAYISMLCALLSHFQTGILLGSRFVGLVSTIQLRATLAKQELIRFLPVVLAGSIAGVWFLSVFSSALFGKIELYSNEHGLLSIANISVLMFCTLVILKQRIEILLILAATAVAASVLGSERLNMVAFFLFSFFVIKQRKTGNPIILLMMGYFAVKGLCFVSDVFVYGTGY